MAKTWTTTRTGKTLNVGTVAVYAANAMYLAEKAATVPTSNAKDLPCGTCPPTPLKSDYYEEQFFRGKIVIAAKR